MSEIFVARQPILDRHRRTRGYELLFRASAGAAGFGGAGAEEASARVLDAAFFSLGVQAITGGKPAFVNFDRAALLAGHATAVPPRLLVVEILEDVTPDAEVLTACRRLRHAGYRLALDDVVLGACAPELLALVDVVKVDFRQHDASGRQEAARLFRSRGLTLLAEKVETVEEHGEAMAAGYQLFQGYFLSRPATVQGRAVPTAKWSLLRLLREIHRPDTRQAEVEALIQHEVGLALKLLTYINTAAFGFRRRVESIRHALVLLGDEGVRRWASVVILAELGADQPFELVVTSVVRATLGDAIARVAGRPELAAPAFVAGLFSLLDALLAEPLAEALVALSVADEVRQALLERSGPLEPIYGLVLAYEAGTWSTVASLAAALAMDPEQLPALYRSAVEWGAATEALAARR